MVDVPAERFEWIVSEALDRIPEELARLMDNVVVLVEDRDPRDPGILGLYQGAPLTERTGYGVMDLPDRITIYRSAVLEICSSEEDVLDEVLVTVVHEVAHHFGIDDERLDELGWG